jgi:small subunit ribosomal protein S6
LSPILSPEEFSGTFERIKDVITQNGGDITQEEQWGMRRLAYPIRRAGQTYLEGNYILTRFSTDTTVPRELEPHLTLSEDVLRFLVVRSEAPKPAPPKPAEPVEAQVEESQPEESVAELVEETGADAPAVATDEPVEADEPSAAQVAEPVANEPAVAEVAESETEEPVAALVEEPVANEPAVAEVTESATEEPAAALVEEPVADEPAVAEVAESETEEPVAALVEEPVRSSARRGTCGRRACGSRNLWPTSQSLSLPMSLR